MSVNCRETQIKYRGDFELLQKENGILGGGKGYFQ